MPDKTLVVRVKLADHPTDLDRFLVDTCDNRLSAGFRLAASFLFKDSELVLFFQKT